jgi:HPt (histidine-containing phosphotransfer) domain-containing protein
MPPARHTSLLANHPDIAEILPRFLTRLRTQVAELRRLHAAGDSEKIRVIAHQLRGAGTSFGFPDLTSAAGDLEETILSNPPPSEISSVLTTLVEYIEQIEGF